MNAVRYQRVKEIFAEASSLAGNERNRFLDEICGQDTELRTEIESLLSHDDHSDGFMDAPMMVGALESLLSTQCLTGVAAQSQPQRIGKYAIIDELGRGGMGVVYRAKQENPAREIALKVIRPGVASPDSLRRFAFETELLGRLRHPGIAQIYEAGTADTGEGEQPYYAMELVRGEPLNDFLKHHELTVPQKLELMIRICEAVHHAHQKGIIHRDLKPGNVLVEQVENDSSFQPKVLDFGVARAIGADDRRTIATSAGQIIGTIAYMSPEQVSGDSNDLDTRSDVYALGVMAFEMLAGCRPHKFGDKPLAECARIIRDDAPLRLCKANPNMAADLETIVAKSLEKDRDRRYQSAAELAADFRRFLNHEPIAARRPTLAYRSRKFVQREPWLSGALIIVLLVVIGGTLWVISAKAATRVAEQRRAMADEMKLDLAGFLPQKEENSDPLRPIHVDPAKLDRISQFVTEKLTSEPQLAIELRNLLGENYILLGEFDTAAVQIQDSLHLLGWPSAQPGIDLGDSLQNMGRVLYHQGRFADAMPMYQQALDVRTQVLGPDHRDTAMTMSHMAACLRRQGDYARAESLYRQVLEMRERLPGNNSAIVASSYNSLAMFYKDQGRWTEAANHFTTAIELVSGQAQPNDLRIARTQAHLADCLIELNRLNEAETLLASSLEVQSRSLPQESPDVANTTRSLAQLRLAQSNVAESERLARIALDVQQKRLGQNHADLADTYFVLGRALMEAQSLEEAADALTRALQIRSANLPQGHWLVVHTQDWVDKCNEAIQTLDELHPNPEPVGLR